MRTTAALVCCLLIALLAGAATVSGTAPTAGGPSVASPAGADAPLASGSGPDAQSVALDDRSTVASVRQSDGADNETRPESIEITIQPDGDARFALVKEFPVETDAERAAFERLAADFEDGEYGDLGYSTYQSIVDDVAAETDREMALTDAGPHVARSDDVGRLEYRFTWTNFASADQERVVVGDAFRTDEGLWLQELREGQRLEVGAPQGYSVAESPSGPEIDGDTLIWVGPASFGPGDLQVSFEESDSGSTFPTSTALFAVLGLLAIGLVLVGWQVASTRSDDEPLGDRVRNALASAGAPAGTFGTGSGGGSDAAGDPESDGTTAVADSAPSAAADASEVEAGQEPVDPELLSDEERVEHLLEQNGGRMKQANIVTETGWSNAKVSQLLSRMAEEERVDKLRIGRENLITLPDVDVTEQE